MLLEGVLIAETEVSGEIDRFHIFGQARDDVHRLPVREREKYTVDVAEILRVFDEVQIRQTIEVAMFDEVAA
jgi:hypothetical protein